MAGETKPKTPKPIEERIEFKEIMDALSQDTVAKSVFVNALKGTDPEHARLNGTEARSILGWMMEKDPEVAAEKFEKIMERLVKIPTTLEGWAEAREEAARDIEEINKRRLACEQAREVTFRELDTLNAVKSTLTREDGSSMLSEKDAAEMEKKIEALKETLSSHDKRLETMTMQISAITLMHAHAKTQEDQMQAKTYVEETKPTRQSLKEWWTERTSQYKTMSQNIKQARQLSHFKRAEVKVQREHLKDARNHAKKSNKLQQKIDKQEQEIIKKAQKIAMSDFRKNRGILGLKAIARGERLAPPNITDIEQAKSFIDQSERAQNSGRLQHMMENLQSLEGMQASHDLATANALGILNGIFEKRQHEIQELAQQVDQQIENGEIGTGRVAMLNKLLDHGLQEAHIDIDDVYFTDELKNFMLENGFGHMIGQDQDIEDPVIGDR